MYDIKITGGTIVDGSGRPRYKADIGIVGDQIAAIGALREQPAHQTIDATGMVVAPGFIDAHTHSDLAALYDPHMAAHIHDGVTTDIIANCGIGTAPVTQKNRQLLLDYLGTRMIGSLPVEIELHWETMNEYLDYLRVHAPAGNIAPLVAQGSIRIAEMGFAMGKAAPEQIKNMQRMVEEAMEAGALGISTGLAYLPGAYTEWEELREVTKPVSRYDGLYISHIRNQSSRIIQSVDEAIAIGKGAEVGVHISHIKLAGPEVRGKTDALLDKIYHAERDGVKATFDLYPYDAGNTALTTVLPPWVFEGGIKNLLNRIENPSDQKKIRRDCQEGIAGWQNYSKELGWGKIRVSSVFTPSNQIWEGMTIQEIAEKQNKDPFDVVFQLLKEEDARVQTIVSHLDERDVEVFLSQPDAMIGSDSMSLSVEGPLSFGKPHPRAFGTHGCILGKYVREKRLMTLEQAVRKMTHLPAERFKINRRGLLKEGYYADITVFNPETITANATYRDPKHYTTGIKAVIVNGKMALEDDKQLETFAGRVVGRG